MGIFVQRCGIGTVLMETLYGQYWGWEKTGFACEAGNRNWTDSKIPISLYLVKYQN